MGDSGRNESIFKDVPESLKHRRWWQLIGLPRRRYTAFVFNLIEIDFTLHGRGINVVSPAGDNDGDISREDIDIC